jgi:peptidylprolyl isomerase
MSPLSKYEAIGIFASVAVMAVALAVLRFQSDTFMSFNDAGAVDQLASIVVANEPSLTEKVTDSMTLNGTLKELVTEDITKGKGESVQKGDTVTVHYIGRLRDGTEFDNSYRTGKPYTFKIGSGKVIQGWDQGIIGMQVGGKRILVVPAELAYGNKQVGPIPANSSLIFAVELLKIE